MTQLSTFTRPCGFALCAAGLLTILINAIVAPLMFGNHSTTLHAITKLYLLRQSASGVTALLLLFGSLGVHLVQRDSVGLFGRTAFLLSFLGGALLFGVEFSDVFVLRALAQTDLAAYAAVDKNTFVTVGFATAAVLFALGWILLAASAWKAKVLPRWAAGTTLAGLVSLPFLQASPLHMNGAFLGNVVFGVGLMGLGWGVATTQCSAPR